MNIWGGHDIVMSVRRPFIIALLVTLLLYIMSLTYNLATIEYRLGGIEHFLTHKGFEGAGCH